MDVGLIDIDQLIAIALCAVPQRAKVLDELHPPRGISTPQQLAGLLPGQSEPVQGTADALAAQQAIEAVLHEPHQTLERPAWRGISARYRRARRSPLGGGGRLFARRPGPPGKRGGGPPRRD